ncbi:MAG: hypothetical protein OIF32_06000, partial [Campylobacterales bacterium]|nr:hypothetical protein [Campylobacterales bacterium]
LISDKMGYVHIVDLVDDEIEMQPIYQSKEVVTTFKVIDEKIFFLFEHGKISFIDIAKDRAKLLKNVEDDDIAQIYKAVGDNPILRFGIGNVLDAHDEKYHKRLELAIIEIANGSPDKAKQIMGNTLNSEAHRERFEQILQHSKKVTEFYNAVRQVNYQRAYAMANSMDLLKKLVFFDKMEKSFEIAFNRALELLIKKKDPKAAKEQFLVFSKVPSKSKIIKSLLAHPEKFSMAKRKLSEKKYDHFAQLVKTFKDLENAPFYKKYQDLKDNMIHSFVISMSECDYKKAGQYCKFLKTNFPELVEVLIDDFEKLEIIDKFEEFIEGKKFGKAMDLASENSFLLTSDSYKSLNNVVSTRMDSAMILAYKGEFKKMHTLLKPFLASDFSKSKALDIYKIYYLEQIEKNVMKLSLQHWKNAIKNYIARFGKDEQIILIGRKYDKDKILMGYEDGIKGNFLNCKLIASVFHH